MAISFLRFALGAGFKPLTLQLLVGIGSNFIQNGGRATGIRIDAPGAATYRKEAWKAYWAALAELQKSKLDKAKVALAAKTAVSIRSGSGAASTAPPAPALAPVPSPVPGVPPAAGYAPASAGDFPGFGLAGVAPVGIDGTGQREKQAYLAQSGDIGTSDVLPFTRTPAPSPYTVSAGTFIPAEMITGGNSDLPGPFSRWSARTSTTPPATRAAR